MLIVIVVVFALCWLPYRGVVVYNSLAQNKFYNEWYELSERFFLEKPVFLGIYFLPKP